ncbi:serine/threonine protein kinase [Christensenellaceae bacterium OttesenSCG-928-M15]|nr:serine/threonine protein kinase [Christensenellaceae bacterium OttesenSCG-928-M15]
MDLHGICLNCFSSRGDYEVCPYCGYVAGTVQQEAYLLYPGQVLAGRFVIGTILGIGGFGVTYKAWDTKLNIMVAVKEFYPAGLVNRIPGEKDVMLFSGDKQQSFLQQKERFLDEARNMARFTGDKHIVNVFDFFEENNTAYIVMEYLDGQTLKAYMASQGGRLPSEEALKIVQALLNAVSTIHEKGIIHRDISPDNIFILRDGRIKVLDFGAARFELNENPQLTQSVVIKLGYAPPEQYRTNMKQGVWTDIYAVGATLYKMLTGITPDESVDRIEKDTLRRPTAMGIPTEIHIEKAIMKAMALKPELRFKSAKHMLSALNNTMSIDFPEEELKKRKRNRAVVVAVSVLAILGLGAFVGYESTRPTAETLANIEIAPDTVTLLAPQGESELYAGLAETFSKQYTDYKVNIVENGDAVLLPAQEKAEGADLSLLLSSLDTSAYFFLSDYEEIYPDKDRIPTGFDMLTAYGNEIAARTRSISLPSNISSAAQMQKLINDQPGVMMKSSNILFFLQYTQPDMFAQDGALQLRNAFSDAEKTAEQYSSGAFVESGDDDIWLRVDLASALREVQSQWPGYYSVIPMTGEDGRMSGMLTGEWKVSATASENQQKVAMLFLHFLLSENAQNTLHVQRDMALPLNRKAYAQYTDINADFQVFTSSEVEKLRAYGKSGGYMQTIAAEFGSEMMALEAGTGDIQEILGKY